MGRLELPIPELGRGTQHLDAAADEMQERIRRNVPERFRESIVVRPFKRRGSSGLAIEYDDAAEPHVFAVIEHPKK